MWKHFIADYFSFTKRDRIGILVLISGIIFFLLLPFFYPLLIKHPFYDHTSFEKAIVRLQIKQADSSVLLASKNQGNPLYKNYDPYAAKPNFIKHAEGELFYFDPNSTSTANWERLGIRDKTIATIQKYLAKGGRFYKKEDIAKIWGLPEKDVQRLMPYVMIKTNRLTEDPSEREPGKKEYKKVLNAPLVVDINNGDTAAFIALPGIGSKLSQRIINFREKLGGFYKIEQVGETYGLPDTTFQKIMVHLKINNTTVKQVNINIATIDEMKLHPYIRFALANAIVQYRTQHGSFMAVSEIKKIMTVSEDLFNKLAPYLRIQ